MDKFLEGVDCMIDAVPSAVPSAPDCSTNVLKCGPPRVDFLGSSGQGATGSAIVNVLGQVIGVAILLVLDIENHLYYHSLIVVKMVMVLEVLLESKMDQWLRL